MAEAPVELPPADQAAAVEQILSPDEQRRRDEAKHFKRVCAPGKSCDQCGVTRTPNWRRGWELADGSFANRECFPSDVCQR